MNTLTVDAPFSWPESLGAELAWHVQKTDPTVELADGGGRRAALERRYRRRPQPRPSEPPATPQPNTNQPTNTQTQKKEPNK